MYSSSILSTTLLLLLTTITTPFVAAQTSTEELTGPSPAAEGTKPGPNARGYTYIGCYNETANVAGSGGVRALAARGQMMASNNLTSDSCLNFCANSLFKYCGMEYGRECYGGRYLNVLSNKLNESNCSYACQGNSSEVCGGSLTITLYNLTGEAKATKTNADGETSTNAAAAGMRTFFTTFGAGDARFGLWSSAALSALALVVMVAL